MSNNTGRKNFFLLSVLCIALVAGYLLKMFIARDVRRSFEEERSASVRLITSDLEKSYERSKAWNREDTAEAAIRALILGMHIAVKDAGNVTVMDTEKALTTLSPDRKARVFAMVVSGGEQESEEQVLPLAAGGEKIGGLAVRFRNPAETLLVRRWSVLIMAWAIFAAALALVPVFFMLRQPAGAASEIRSGRSASEASLEKKSPEKPRRPSEGEVVEENIPLVNAPAAEVQDAEPDEPSDEDEAMQPLAGDEGRIKKIIAGLDELARVEALGRSLRKQPIDLAQHLSAAVEKARGAVQDKEVTYTIECGQELVLAADPECLSGILANLLENAAQAVKKSGTVTVSATQDGDRVRLAIRDTGRGIKRKDMPHIFERFYRGSGNGIGLGLTIVKALVDASGGTIEVESARGSGCLVTVRMPKDGERRQA